MTVTPSIPRHTMLALGLVSMLGLLANPASANESREAIEARIESLQQELQGLQRQLERHQDDEDLDSLDEIAASQDLAAEVETRRRLEQESSRNPFALTMHRANYLFPLSYAHSSPNSDSFQEITDANTADDIEIKFQFSAKVRLAEELFGDNGDLYFGYTQRSWWQAYNTDASSPFRETNYEPELFLDFDNNWRVLGWTNINNRVSLNHQSNGRSEPLSRSWNRVILESAFVKGDWGLILAPHWRIPESDGDDDNPDIQRYMGYGDITLARRLGNDHEASLLARGNPSAGNLSGRFDYSWPLFGAIRGHVQYYYGYGESMIDYDHRNSRLSIGFSLNPMFSGTSSLDAASNL